MKNKTVYLILMAVMMLFIAPKAKADDGGYLIRFYDGYLPDTTEYGLECINADERIYRADDFYLLKPIEEHIEYYSKNRSATLVPMQTRQVAMLSLPTDEFYQEQWQLDIINAEAGMRLHSYGNDVRVAVIDSGCYPHRDLKDNLLTGKNYIGKSNDVTDNHGHGTHVSGIIAAEMNAVGTVGVAPRAKIVPLKCFDPAYNTYVSDLLQAIYDAVDVYDCRIINMSWGIGYDDDFLKKAINYAYDKGAILVSAVGNYGSTGLYYPAAYDNVIGVTSVDNDKSKSDFAQYNFSVTVAAGGDDVVSTYKDGGYYIMYGTSQATPMVSGVAAVALSINPKLTNTEFTKLLTRTAEDLGDEGYDVRFGYGLVDEAALIEAIMKNIDYYVSPVNIFDGEASVLIKNNTGERLDCISLFAGYKYNRLAHTAITPVVLPAGAETVIRTKGATVHFLWSMEGMAPLADKR